MNQDYFELATFGGGCFWCTEALFQSLRGVLKVEPGYCGGRTNNPTYQQVCTGETGHAEVIQVTFNPSEISYSDLLEVFFNTHDPTTLNRQGADVGTQYRSVVFFHNEQQRKKAETIKQEIHESGRWDDPLVTEICPYSTFYKAEGYHKNYFNENPSQPYCTFVIAPKLESFRKKYSQLLETD